MTRVARAVGGVRSVAAIRQQHEAEDAADATWTPAVANIQDALLRLRASADVEALAEGLVAGRDVVVEAAGMSLDVDPLRAVLRATLARGFARGAATAARAVPPAVAPAARRALATAESRAAAWSAEHGARLVRSVAGETREAIREAVSSGIRRGQHVGAIARDLRDVVGLTPRGAGAVENFRSALRAEGVAANVARARVARYADRLVRQRAELIARTETFRALNKGRQDVWAEMVSAGDLGADDVRRTWATARDERVDDVCWTLEGRTVGLNAVFRSGAGEYAAPPDPHPGCRCTILYRSATA